MLYSSGAAGVAGAASWPITAGGIVVCLLDSQNSLLSRGIYYSAQFCS